jgi:hypothetical protein
MQLIPLTKGYFAKIDDTDFAKVSQFKWYAPVHKRRNGAIKTVYARRSIWAGGKRQAQYMHAFLAGKGADHWDGDGLNNQSHNLRSASHAQNQHNQGIRCNNTSGFKGVYWEQREKRNKPWRAQIAHDHGRNHLGYFDTAVEAAKAYNAAALLYHGEFARLNDIPAEATIA